MITLDLMELADCFTPEQLVESIFTQCPNLIAPIPIEDIARVTGICRIEALPGNSENIEGMLCTDKTKECGVIFFNRKRPLGRQRFTIGHELGHFLLLSHSAEQWKCSANDLRRNDNPEEAEANKFAQKLLLPEHLLLPELKDKILDVPLINHLSALFQMSFEATANAVVPLSNEAVAIVFIKDRKVRYSWLNFKHFRHTLKVNKHDYLPQSYQRGDVRPNSATDFVKLVAHDWLDIDPESKWESAIYGQTFVQENGFSAILLKITPLS